MLRQILPYLLFQKRLQICQKKRKFLAEPRVDLTSEEMQSVRLCLMKFVAVHRLYKRNKR